MLRVRPIHRVTLTPSNEIQGVDQGVAPPCRAAERVAEAQLKASHTLEQRWCTGSGGKSNGCGSAATIAVGC